MSFTRQVLTSKQSFSASDHSWADTILARRQAVEPRCNANSAFCLSLRGKGDFVEYAGKGPDAGKELHLSFLQKGTNTLRLAYFAPGEFANNAEILEALSKAVKDALQGSIATIYWYVRDSDPASDDKAVLSALAAQIEEDWPSLEIAVSHPAGFTRWEVTQ